MLVGAGDPGGIGSALAAVGAFVPTGRLDGILTTGWSDSLLDRGFWISLAAAAACFLAAWAAFDATARRGAGVPARPGVAGGRKGLRRWANPGRTWAGGGRGALMWKDYHFVAGGRPGLVLRLLILAGPVLVAGIAVAVRDDLTPSVLGATLAITGCALFALDAALQAGRVFRDEIREKTLSQLWTLPLEMKEIVSAKTRGCLAACAPGLVAAFLGGILLLATTSYREMSAAPFGFILFAAAFMILHGAAQLILLVHLTACLSLEVRWGALPLALAITMFAQPLAQMIFMVIPLVGLLGIVVFAIPIVPIVATVILRKRIQRRLPLLAAEA